MSLADITCYGDVSKCHRPLAEASRIKYMEDMYAYFRHGRVGLDRLGRCS
ncbi:MAG: hypothetical protein JWM55_1127 [Acidimicrobiaceae bacterium]|nr:hypothetical protein [Acidimicrobiaceae bacterium]